MPRQDVDPIAHKIEELLSYATMKRKYFERSWYDNNFFDDGYHQRYVSRETGSVIDGGRVRGLPPIRAIPKASRQLRGVANLLLQPDFTPSIYPKYPLKPANMQVDDPMWQQIRAGVEQEAKQVGFWVEDQWERLDFFNKLTEMLILAGKNSVSYLQVWQEYGKQKICAKVFDAFDIYIDPAIKDIEDSSFVIKCIPTTLDQIKANAFFDEDKRMAIQAENKHSESAVKNQYLTSHFGTTSEIPRVILKEVYLKKYLTKDMALEIRSKSPNFDFTGKQEGDCVIEHIFMASGVILKDEYLNLDSYPFVALTLEPGYLYQTSLIERFIPANKSLDMVVSRIENWTSSMGLGIWAKQKGENWDITTTSLGQIVEYVSTPPISIPPASMPGVVIEFANYLNSIIEEQGASTSTLASLPSGIRSGKAIESLKESEYSNLEIPSNQLKICVEKITRKIIEIGSSLIDPQEVERKEGDNYQTYRLGTEADPKEGLPTIKKDYKIKIEIENGLGYTMSGKKESMKEIIAFFTPLVQQGMISDQGLKLLTERFLEIYQFGATAEFANEMGATPQKVEDEITKIKLGTASALKDVGLVGPEFDDKLVNATKVGLLESQKDTKSPSED